MSSIIVYHYFGSPFSQLVRWYLALRQIEHTECLQPVTMPRPDLAALGVGYRRIPLVSIDRDIFCDTPLIIDELEHRTRGQGNPLPTVPATEGYERFLRQWSGESVFLTVASILPSDLPMLTPEFMRDRAQLTGLPWDAERMNRARPQALAKMREEFSFVENVLLGPERKWILGTAQPSLGDLYAVWPFAWAVQIPGALGGTDMTPARFPRTFDWISRFVAHATESSRKVKVDRIDGESARKSIVSSAFRREKEAFDAADPCGHEADREVDVAPVDWGRSNPTRGRLVGLSTREYVVEVQERGGGAVRVHFPRRGFAAKPVPASRI